MKKLASSITLFLPTLAHAHAGAGETGHFLLGTAVGFALGIGVGLLMRRISS